MIVLSCKIKLLLLISLSTSVLSLSKAGSKGLLTNQIWCPNLLNCIVIDYFRYWTKRFWKFWWLAETSGQSTIKRAIKRGCEANLCLFYLSSVKTARQAVTALLNSSMRFDIFHHEELSQALNLVHTVIKSIFTQNRNVFKDAVKHWYEPFSRKQTVALSRKPFSQIKLYQECLTAS